MLEMVWMYSTELGFAAGGFVALYFRASNSVVCLSAISGALLVASVRRLLEVRGIYRAR